MYVYNIMIINNPQFPLWAAYTPTKCLPPKFTPLLILMVHIIIPTLRRLR